jgi:hypothetical protein
VEKSLPPLSLLSPGVLLLRVPGAPPDIVQGRQSSDRLYTRSYSGARPGTLLWSEGLEPPQHDGVVNRCVDASEVRELLWRLWRTPSAAARPCPCTRRRLWVVRARTVIFFRRPLSRSSPGRAPVLSCISFRKP